MRRNYICLLPVYANAANITHERSVTEDAYAIRFSRGAYAIRLCETNSLIEERYSMNLHCAEYVMQGQMTRTEVKEAMIHHHPQGHPWRHLQFRLKAENKVIRIRLDPMDAEDYERCIKGFVSTARRILDYERSEHAIDEDLVGHFFNAKVDELEADRRYLLRRIAAAYREGGFLDDADRRIPEAQLESLRREAHLLPFLDWE